MALRLPQYTPIAIHIGALDARFLQLQGGATGWRVRSSACYPAQGGARHAHIAEQAAGELKSRRWRGKDAVVGLGSDSVEVTLVPIDHDQAERQEQKLEQTALAAVEDPEGVAYRWLPFNSTPGMNREELLLLTTGASELRRTTAAVESMGLRPVSMEMSSFGLSRALLAMRDQDPAPWGFLHIGFDRTAFGILHQGEVRFLKPMQLDGRTLLGALQREAESLERRKQAPAEGPTHDLFAGAAFGDLAGERLAPKPILASEVELKQDSLSDLHRVDIEHAVELLGAVQREADKLAEEVRACIRHFHSRNKGAELDGISLSGFGATLPEVEAALHQALDAPVTPACPFSELGIHAPAEVLNEEHLWAPALGLAMRGFE
ncbi:MAG: pilus assembly protein PilM [Planctomycetes bacterium]|nr:pilus assembly protein PilM [Planctomycetota bacterium]MBL7007599.1 pilus assembly protein PilM [Planctomycetota bacterium]